MSTVTLQSKPTVLIIIHHYLPGQLTGGPVRTTSNLIEALGDDIDFRIITLDRDKGTNQPYRDIQYGTWHPVGKAQVSYLRPQDFRFWSLSTVLQNSSFDLIYLDSVLAPSSILTLALRRLRLIAYKPVIIAPRGHLDRGAMTLKSFKKRAFLHAAKLFGLYLNVVWHASSNIEKADLLREFGSRIESDIRVVSELTAPRTDGPAFNLPTKQPGSLRVVYLSRISKKKNIDFVLEVLKTTVGNIDLDIYGPIEDADYWAQCQTLTNTLPASIKVSYKGIVPFEQVSSVISNYHLFVLPTLGENFGHVILEALSVGCPVLISDRTPWGSIAEHGAGWVVPLSQPERYRDVLHAMLALDSGGFEQLVRSTQEYGAHQREQKRQTVQNTKNLLYDTIQAYQVVTQ